MKICEQCKLLQAIEQCDPDLFIGVADADTDYNVYIRNLATGRTDTYNTTSDGSGNINIVLDGILSENQGYEVWVNTTSESEEGISIVNNGNTNKCFIFQFMKGAISQTVINGIYVNGFSSILGNNTNTTALTTFTQSKGLNDLTFYMGSLLDDSGNRTSMRTLMTNITSLGITRRASNVTQSSGCIGNGAGTEATYNSGCISAAQKFTGFTQEWEFWHSNPYGDFATFKVQDKEIYDYCQANGMYYDIYVARCRDYTGTFTDSQVADHLVLYHDTIFLVDYVSTAKFNTYSGLSDGIKTQLNLISAAAKRIGKYQKVVILFASEGNNGDNMRTYYVANPTLISSYTKFKTAYDKYVSYNRLNITMLGQKIYGYNGISDL